MGVVDRCVADASTTSVVGCGTGPHDPVWQRVGRNELACQYGDRLQELRQSDRGCQAGSSPRSLLRVEGDARWSRRRKPTRFDRHRAVPDVVVSNRATPSGLELRRTVCDHRHACVPVELYRRADHACGCRPRLCRCRHQFRQAQTVDAAGLCRDLFLECKRSAHTLSGHGGLWRQL